ncbi:MAG: peptidylprolyl isomerase [Pseudomonadota bacterium]|nr:peptidylprolyl isomerase [Pseudomonadota bacterium]
MSTPLPTYNVQPPASSSNASSVPNWLREPLLHFVVLGGLLFALDHFSMGRTDDPHTIVIGADVDAEARKLFSDARGHTPDDKELGVLRERWLDNEVLYREGLAMRVDQGDPTIRERVIFKSLMAVEAGLKLPPADDKQLRAWFESHRAKYDQPARFDFQEAVLPGDTTEADVRAFADALNAGMPGDAKAGLRVFKGRPHDNLVQGYGTDFAKALEESPVGPWRALPTRDGLRVMRLESITQPQPASFEALRGVVQQDWVDDTMAQIRTDAVRKLGKKYTVKIEEATK